MLSGELVITDICSVGFVAEPRRGVSYDAADRVFFES